MYLLLEHCYYYDGDSEEWFERPVCLFKDKEQIERAVYDLTHNVTYQSDYSYIELPVYTYSEFNTKHLYFTIRYTINLKRENGVFVISGTDKVVTKEYLYLDDPEDDDIEDNKYYYGFLLGSKSKSMTHSNSKFGNNILDFDIKFPVTQQTDLYDRKFDRILSDLKFIINNMNKADIRKMNEYRKAIEKYLNGVK